MKKRISAVVLAALLLAAACLWLLWRQSGGVSHVEIRDTVVAESGSVKALVDARCDALERKLDAIEGKLDLLIRMATPQLPDGMSPARGE